MNIVLVYARGNISACVVREDASALQLEGISFRNSPFEASTSSEKLIRLLVDVLRQGIGERKSSPVRLVAYVPPGTDTHLVARLEASAFAAGFEQVRLLTLAEIAAVIVRDPLRGRVLAIDARADEITALDFEVAPDGAYKNGRALSTGLGMSSLQSAFLSLLDGEGQATLVSRHPDILRELALLWGRSPDREWIAEARRWTPEGWRAVCVTGAAARRLDELVRRELRQLVDVCVANEFQAIVVVGELGNGVVRVVNAEKESQLKSSNLLTHSVQEGAVQWVRERRPPPLPGAPWNSQVHVLLDFETARLIGAEESKLPRNPARVPLAIDQRMVIANVPVMAYADGIQLQIEYASNAAPIAVLGGAIRKFKKPSFGVDMLARQLPDGGLVVRVDCSGESARAIVLVRPGCEPAVLEFEQII